MAPVAQREWLESFIELYKSEPCLWKIKSTEYYDRSKKDAAYEKLINKLCEIEPTATRESVIKKINNLRCTYKKEYKKVVASLASSETVYEPKLWYYSLLSFLDCQEASRTSGSDFDKTIEMSKLKLSDITSGSGTDTEQTSISEEDWKFLIVNSRETTELNGSVAGSTADDSYRWSPKTNTSLSTDAKDVGFAAPRYDTPLKEDRSDIVGRLVTLKLRDLSKEQGLLAEKIINEALFKAEMGTLTAAHGVEAVDASGRGSAFPAYCSLCDAVLLDLPVPVLEFGAATNGAEHY